MHRALGGAPTLSVQWRSLGRSLRANVNACAAWLAALRQKKIKCRGVRPRFSFFYTLKTKFFRKELGRSALGYAKNYRDGAMPRLLASVRQRTVWRGAAPTPRPA